MKPVQRSTPIDTAAQMVVAALLIGMLYLAGLVLIHQLAA